MTMTTRVGWVSDENLMHVWEASMICCCSHLAFYHLATLYSSYPATLLLCFLCNLTLLLCYLTTSISNFSCTLLLDTNVGGMHNMGGGISCFLLCYFELPHQI